MTAYTQPIVWGPSNIGQWVGAFTGPGLSGTDQTNLSDGDNSVAFTFVIKKAGSITDVGFYCNGITGNPPAYNTGLVTVDGASGSPTTTAYGGSAITTYDFTAAGWVWITLSTPATAVAGELASVRVWPDAGSPPDGSNYASIHRGGIFASAMPTVDLFATGWTQQNYLSTVAARYSDGDIIGLPAVGFVTAEINTASTPDEVGVKFVLPADMKCVGARCASRGFDANATFTVKLYDNADNLLGSAGAFDEDVTAATTANADYFWTEVSLTAGSTYRLTVLPTNASAGMFHPTLDFESTASKEDAVPDGANWTLTYRTDAGAWTDDASAVCFYSILVSEITFAAAASGGAYGFAS